MNWGQMNLWGVFNWRDLLDIALVTVLVYQIRILIRGTRALSALGGLVSLLVVYLVS